MVAATSGMSTYRIDIYNILSTIVNQTMSLPIIKSDLSDSDSKVKKNYLFENDYSFINTIIISA